MGVRGGSADRELVAALHIESLELVGLGAGSGRCCVSRRSLPRNGAVVLAKLR
jgi:hypothetical protein